MSYPAFIARALGISLGVYLRFLPVLIFVIFLFGALYLTTSDPIVYGIITFVMLTIGWTFLYLMLLRNALYALRATTPSNVDSTIKGVAKLMFIHFLAQLVIIVAIAMASYLFLYRFTLPDVAPQAYALMQEGAPYYHPAVISQSGTIFAVFQLTITLGAIIVTSLFGGPMAAVAANTAEISPNVDMITGFGRYFAPQFTLSLLGVLIPSAVIAFLAPTLAERLATASIGGVVIGVGLTFLLLVYFSWCIPVCGMALTFVQVREEQAEARAVEAAPIFDAEEQKQSLRDLRAKRQSGGKATSVYDPKG